MNIKDFIIEMELLMELDKGTLQEDTTLNNLPAWDSLAVIGYIALADEVFQKLVAPKDIAQAKTIQDLYLLVNS